MNNLIVESWTTQGQIQVGHSWVSPPAGRIFFPVSSIMHLMGSLVLIIWHVFLFRFNSYILTHWKTKYCVQIFEWSRIWALAAATCEIQRLLCLPRDLHVTFSEVLVIYCDSQRALLLTQSSMSERTIWR